MGRLHILTPWQRLKNAETTRFDGEPFGVGHAGDGVWRGDPTPVPAAPSVSAQDIQDAVDRAIAGAAAAETSPAEIQAMIEAAVTAAAASGPEGLTASQVEAIVAAAASPEGLTASQVEAIVAAALAAAPTAMPMAEGPFVIGVMESLTGPG